MVLNSLVYSINSKEQKINVKVCRSIWSKLSGLMFRKNSPPLLFVFKNERQLNIHSFFCKPFRAIWLDKKGKATKSVDIFNWKPNISGYGKYLLEIPLNHRRQQ
jgi:uncharacterized membrane protein (UPF0127 family)